MPLQGILAAAARRANTHYGRRRHDRRRSRSHLRLKWLVRQQMTDGRWMLNSPNLPDKDRSNESNDIAATAARPVAVPRRRQNAQAGQGE